MTSVDCDPLRYVDGTRAFFQSEGSVAAENVGAAETLQRLHEQVGQGSGYAATSTKQGGRRGRPSKKVASLQPHDEGDANSSRSVGYSNTSMMIGAAASFPIPPIMNTVSFVPFPPLDPAASAAAAGAPGGRYLTTTSPPSRRKAHGPSVLPRATSAGAPVTSGTVMGQSVHSFSSSLRSISAPSPLPFGPSPDAQVNQLQSSGGGNKFRGGGQSSALACDAHGVASSSSSALSSSSSAYAGDHTASHNSGGRGSLQMTISGEGSGAASMGNQPAAGDKSQQLRKVLRLYRSMVEAGIAVPAELKAVLEGLQQAESEAPTTQVVVGSGNEDEPLNLQSVPRAVASAKPAPAVLSLPAVAASAAALRASGNGPHNAFASNDGLSPIASPAPFVLPFNSSTHQTAYLGRSTGPFSTASFSTASTAPASLPLPPPDLIYSSLHGSPFGLPAPRPMALPFIGSLSGGSSSSSSAAASSGHHNLPFLRSVSKPSHTSGNLSDPSVGSVGTTSNNNTTPGTIIAGLSMFSFGSSASATDLAGAAVGSGLSQACGGGAAGVGRYPLVTDSKEDPAMTVIGLDLDQGGVGAVGNSNGDHGLAQLQSEELYGESGGWETSL